jgi:hypothetical protein
MLSILRDPGPMTDSAQRGSGFLCLENDDATAERFAMFLTDAGLRAENMVPWNAYPWYINRPPKAAELDAGVDPLRRLINVLPNVRVVMLNGREAQSIWSRYELRFPESATRLLALRTYHPSNQAFIGTREVREARLAQLRESFARAAAAIREEPLPR